MIRIIAAVLFVTLFLIVSLPMIGVELLLGLFSRKARDKSSLAIVAWAFRVVERIAGTKTTVIGEENIPKDEAVLFVSNHRSIFDTVLLYGRMKQVTGFVAKTETKKIPVLSWWMILLHCKFLDRHDIKQGLQVILSCIEDVKNGISIMIFPEGTRGKGEDETEVLDFKEGSMKVAVKGGVRIVPIAISGSRAILEAQFPRVKPARVVIRYGKPIDPKEFTKEEQKRMGEVARGRIIDMLKESGVQR
ncbi:MAG: 1-acyl-sn-glycerol-3-phosphate acyltransferase [Lachnospiraceae bacterium]|nr:1-acyl-sn-glycerol-3-phosphate acyltransferase [Lachnospiraceae bacterium]